MNKLWKNTSLDGEWKLYFAENCKVKKLSNINLQEKLNSDIFTCIDGKVPGNFELDMQRAELLPDLLYSTNVIKAQKLENLHLWYARTFEWNGENADQMYFDFEGIDTFSEIYLNGNKIAETDNMYIAHEFKAVGLKQGENELLVHIKPAVIEARSREVEPYARGMYHNMESLAVRKAPHMYGWDIMPRIISGGIWRSVYLYERPIDYIDDLYIYSFLTEPNKARLLTYYKVNLETSDFNRDYTLRVTGKCKNSTFSVIRTLWHVEGTEQRDLLDPEIWWPRDMGEQNLYDVTAELLFKGEVVDTYKTRIGIRNIKLEYTDITDENGSGEFKFSVNGQPLFIRGTNWVPLNPFHSLDKERLPKALELLWGVGCNAVRCWGGNVYEDHEFFDFCDEKGILVWQDFAMGCAVYPQTEQLCDALRTEAISVVKKLRQHASLALWAGDNECDISMGAHWIIPLRNPEQNILTRKLLPDVIRRFDPIRQYLPSSPYLSENTMGKIYSTSEQHLWQSTVYFKDEFYFSKNVAHFASETGYHSCASPKSIEKFVAKDKLFPCNNNPDWIVHATQMILPVELGGENTEFDIFAYMERIGFMPLTVKIFFDYEADNLYDFALSSQIVGAEALKFFVERFRTAKWRRTGIMWWNLTDGWPAFSEASVDYFGTKKLSYFFLRNVQQPICIMFREPENGKLTLIGANETMSEQKVSYKVRELTQCEVVLEGDAIIQPNGNLEIADLPEVTEGVKFYAIEWTHNGKLYRNHYVAGNPPYDYKQYVEWLKEAGVLELEGF